MAKGIFKNKKERARKISLALTGKKFSQEHRKKLSESHIGKQGYWLGKKRIGQGIGLWMKGKKFSPKHIENMRKASILRESYKSLPKCEKIWKGDRYTYELIHKKVNKLYGKPDMCEKCNKTGLFGRKIHWANKSGKYLIIKKDWKRLCASCHKNYEIKKYAKAH